MSLRRIQDHELRSVTDFIDRSNIHVLDEMRSGDAANAMKTLAVPGHERDLIEFSMSLVKMQSTIWVKYVRSNKLLKPEATARDRAYEHSAWKKRFETQDLPKLIGTIKHYFAPDDIGFVMREVFESIHSSYDYAAAYIGLPYPESPGEF